MKVLVAEDEAANIVGGANASLLGPVLRHTLVQELAKQHAERLSCRLSYVENKKGSRD